MYHIVAGLPSYDGRLYVATHRSLDALKTAVLSSGNRYSENIVSQCRFKLARSILFSSFLASDATHFLSVDADMRFPPGQVLRMLQKDAPIVVTPGPTKSRNSRWAVRPRLEDMTPGPDGFGQCDTVGLCLALIRRDALEGMREHYPQQRRALTPQGAIPLYAWFDDLPGPVDIEPDHAFLTRWRKAGGVIWCDTQPEVAHCGYAEYTISYPSLAETHLDRCNTEACGLRGGNKNIWYESN